MRTRGGRDGPAGVQEQRFSCLAQKILHRKCISYHSAERGIHRTGRASRDHHALKQVYDDQVGPLFGNVALLDDNVHDDLSLSNDIMFSHQVPLGKPARAKLVDIERVCAAIQDQFRD